jgi:glyoxylase-like metal-dependent hydrolase (beta-lactamase superfamily II)
MIPTVERLSLPLPWGGLVHPTLIKTSDQCILVDCGHSSSASRSALIEALQGQAPDLLILTHGHQDHYGGIPALLEAFPGLPVYAARCAKPYYEDQRRTVLAHRAALESFAHRVGVEGALLEQLLSGFERIANSGCTTPLARLLDDGDELEFSGLNMRVHHHPGHHHHHLVLELEEAQRVITGDNIFTTNLTPPQVRFDDQGKRIPELPRLIDSLHRLAALGGHALPSHGPELPDVSAVTLRAIGAYERTAERVRKALSGYDQPPPLPELLQAVFGEVPLPFVGLRLGFLLGYADLVGAGADYR